MKKNKCISPTKEQQKEKWRPEKRKEEDLLHMPFLPIDSPRPRRLPELLKHLPQGNIRP